MILTLARGSVRIGKACGRGWRRHQFPHTGQIHAQLICLGAKLQDIPLQLGGFGLLKQELGLFHGLGNLLLHPGVLVSREKLLKGGVLPLGFPIAAVLHGAAQLGHLAAHPLLIFCQLALQGLNAAVAGQYR